MSLVLSIIMGEKGIDGHTLNYVVGEEQAPPGPATQLLRVLQGNSVLPWSNIISGRSLVGGPPAVAGGSGFGHQSMRLYHLQCPAR